MESTSFVALRTVVVLACVVTVPMLAVVGTSHWNEVSAALVQLRDTWNASQAGQPLIVGATGSSASASGNVSTPGGTAAPVMVAAAPGSSYISNPVPTPTAAPPGVGPIAGPRSSPATAAVDHHAASGETPAGSSVANHSNSGAKPAAPFWAANPLAAPFEASAGANSTSAAGPNSVDAANSSSVPLRDRAMLTPPPEVEADQMTSHRPDGLRQPDPTAADASWTSSDRLARVPHRLQELGALHYRLESCGADGNNYRFQCAMPAMSDGRPPQSFQATNADPVQAMEQVLHQIEIWSRGGSSVRG